MTRSNIDRLRDLTQEAIGLSENCYVLPVRLWAIWFKLLVAAVALWTAGSVAAGVLEGAPWTLARSDHFEVYSHAGSDAAFRMLAHFEELRSFFDQQRVMPGMPPATTKLPVRVILFSSKSEYDGYKVRPIGDAYYNGTADRDYIVMPPLRGDEYRIAAHEYSHFVMHSVGLKLPTWLSEGIAEVFSTVNIDSRRCELGGQIASHVDVLHRNGWLSASELLTADPTSPLRQSRSGTSLFYAQSWAVADLLTGSPQYARRFDLFVNTLRSGDVSSQQALVRVYGKSAEEVMIDAQTWLGRARAEKHVLPVLAPVQFKSHSATLSGKESQFLIADLLFANGELGRSEQLYKELLNQSPNDPIILGSLGTVLLQKGERQKAIEYWREAIDHGITDAALCYRYALLADDMNLPVEERERALQRAIENKPNFDDARYRLALIESNTGQFSAAVQQLQRIAKPRQDRAFAHWIALANALSEDGKREEAGSAAKQAFDSARTAEERRRATEIAYFAKTDLAVRYERDQDGSLKLVTTRVTHGSTEFNPFVEPGDRIQVMTGMLQEVQCVDGKLTGFRVSSNGGAISLSVPDPQHVLLRNGPQEFYCGAQPAKPVKVEYAKSANVDEGILRGMEFQ